MMADSVSAPGQGHHRRTAAVLRFLAMASIVIPVLILVAGGLITWRDKQQEAMDQTIRLVDLVYESASKLFEAQLLATDQVRLMIGTRDDAQVIAEQQDLHLRLQAMLRYLPHLRTLFVVTRDGRAIVDGDRYPAPAANGLSERDYFTYFRDGGTGLFVGRPALRLVDQLPFFPLAVRRFSADGQFNGVIAASVDPSYFATFFHQVLHAYTNLEDRTIVLRRGNGDLLVRWPAQSPSNETRGEAVAGGVLRGGGDSGSYISAWQGKTRLVAWRRLHDVDMAVFTSVSMDGVRRFWLDTMLPYLFFGLCSALALFSISIVALRRTQMAEAAETRAAAERQRRERAETAVRQSQKMEAIGKLTGGVAHDFNNLLAVIQGSAELARNRPPDKVARLLDNIVHASRRGAALTRQLLSFSRTQSLAPRVLDPRAEIPRAMGLVRPSLRGDIQVDVQVAEDVWPIEVDPGEWEIALLNIAVNARDAMPNGGWFRVTAGNRRVAAGDVATAPEIAGDFVRITLRDTGSGIPPEVAARAFEPFFTTKDIGQGTGLGLSQVYGFARQAGGASSIEACQDQAGGTIVTLHLPRALKAVEHPPDLQATDAAPAGATKRILLVEDNMEVAAITGEIIRSLGYEVVHATRAREALDRLDAPGPTFHLLITDIVMPDGISGLQLATTVRARMPALPIILVSGYNDATPQEASAFRVLRKPLPARRLAEAIRSELPAWPRIAVDNTVAG